MNLLLIFLVKNIFKIGFGVCADVAQACMLPLDAGVAHTWHVFW